MPDVSCRYSSERRKTVYTGRQLPSLLCTRVPDYSKVPLATYAARGRPELGSITSELLHLPRHPFSAGLLYKGIPRH